MKKLNLSTLLTLLESNTALAAKLLTPGAILGLLKLYNEYETAAADGYITAAEGFQLGNDVLTFLSVSGITIADLQALVAAAQPIFVPAK